MRQHANVTSLREMGFSVETTRGKDAKGNDWVYKVVGKAPVFFIKRTKNGKLLAFKTKEAEVDSTINGLFDFREQNGDLIGRRNAPTGAGEQKPVRTTARTPIKTAA